MSIANGEHVSIGTYSEMRDLAAEAITSFERVESENKRLRAENERLRTLVLTGIQLRDALVKCSQVGWPVDVQTAFYRWQKVLAALDGGAVIPSAVSGGDVVEEG